MYNYRIIHESGRISIIRARTKATAINLFLLAEGCSRTSFNEHYIIRCSKA